MISLSFVGYPEISLCQLQAQGFFLSLSALAYCDVCLLQIMSGTGVEKLQTILMAQVRTYLH